MDKQAMMRLINKFCLAYQKIKQTVRTSEFWFAVLALLVSCHAAFVATSAFSIAREVRLVRESVLWDIDKARTRMLNELNFVYMQGCRSGAEYKPSAVDEWGSSSGFYCDDKREGQQDYFYEQVGRLGK